MKKIKKDRWDKFNIVASFMGALATIVAVFVAWESYEGASYDAKKALNQQQIITQGDIVRECMNEFFQIQQDAYDKWLSTNVDQTKKNEWADIYTKRMAGLHFEEYHLFQRELIPRHIYAVWLQNINKQTFNPQEYTNELPPFNKQLFLTNTEDPDFDLFYSNVLASPKNLNTLNTLASNELNASSETP